MSSQELDKILQDLKVLINEPDVTNREEHLRITHKIAEIIESVSTEHGFDFTIITRKEFKDEEDQPIDVVVYFSTKNKQSMSDMAYGVVREGGYPVLKRILNHYLEEKDKGKYGG
jgi:flavodoxin